MSSFEVYRSVALGIFDGVHLGHQALLEENRKDSEEAWVYTFENLPETVVRPNCVPRLIQPFRLRQEYLQRECDKVIAPRFSGVTAEQEPEDFFQEVLRSQLQAQRFVVGPNYRFGHKGRGDVALLRALCQSHGLQLNVVEPIVYQDTWVSSTRIREALIQGDLDEASWMLGRSFEIEGEVCRGQQLGRTLGYPTANIDYDNDCVRLPYGVYAVYCHSLKAYGLANWGVRPSVKGGDSPRWEVYFLGVNRDLYGKTLRLSVLRFCRPEQQFSDLAQLKKQIECDEAWLKAQLPSLSMP